MSTSNNPINDRLVEHVKLAILEAAKGNSQASAPTAAVLWTDKDCQWQPAIPSLMELLPGLIALGAYNPTQRSGPAIWIKYAIAGLISEFKITGVPVIYLPGVSRADLRAIENCPRDLQPLAELQYRGVFWSQANSKDWTLTAYLSSKNGGLGLDVSQDKATQDALEQAMKSGHLLECKFSDLKNRAINAEWCLSLLAPNPTRDILLWMNDPEETQKKWGDVLWNVFCNRCKADYGFDPIADGILAAVERLASSEGKWAAVSTLYHDSFRSFPNIYGLLTKLQPPQLGLFPDQDQLSGYPQANEQGEVTLRRVLMGCESMGVEDARSAVLAAENEHGIRRSWLWARMGLAQLATALDHLAELAELSKSLPIGQNPNELATSYQSSGWLVDNAALSSLSCVHSKVDAEAISAVLRAIYLPWLEESARRLQKSCKESGGFPKSDPKPVDSGTCFIFVDGLRYDVATRLQNLLSGIGDVHLSASWTCLPSVTASGKAWCSPVASYITGTAEDVDFEPHVTEDGKPLSTHNFRRLLSDKGIQPLDKHETGDPKGCAWTEAGDLDHYGHEHGVRLARDLDTQLTQVVERVTELLDAGWKSIRIVTDHGWLLMPGGLPKSELPRHQTETRWGRCAVLKENAHGTDLTFGWDWCTDVQIAYAPGVTNFVAGAEYAHGGISFQECLVPTLVLKSARSTSENAIVRITAISWRGLRCTVTLDGDTAGLSVDIRTKASLPSSSIAASIKPVESDKASLAVADDEYIGAAAMVVVLDSDGIPVQKLATTVGE